MRYLAGPADVTFAAWRGSDPSLDPANDLRQWRAAIERHESYDELILWFEHDLFDQLNLIQLLPWIRERLLRQAGDSGVHRRVSRRPDFKGLGELTPDELASLLETRQRVSDPQYALAERPGRPFVNRHLRLWTTSGRATLRLSVSRRRDHPFPPGNTLRAPTDSRERARLLGLADGDESHCEGIPADVRGEHVYYITDTSLASTG